MTPLSSEVKGGGIRFAWLLEQSIDGEPAYWDGGHAESFTRDADKAVQFARRDDCFWACRHLMQWRWKFVEHGFMGDFPARREDSDGG
jgi:hypothetical protein